VELIFTKLVAQAVSAEVPFEQRRGRFGVSLLLKTVLVALALSGVATTGYVFYNGALSPDNWVYEGGKATNWQNGGVHGAPGPIAGAGLPILAVGYGVYWLIRRRRKSQ
jgi:hypothetical protein